MQAKNTIKADFRTDINGLRAWAVVAVVLYHFGVPGFGGGFVGVDVFFVISGFLMTGIVVKGLEHGNFSLIGFYLARGKRIIPALAVLCAVLLGLGWLFLLPPDYKMLATHAVYSLSFLSNIEFWQEAGYFDLASHEKWLLHTWSLSVEWQFYMVLPVVLWCAWRLKAGRAAQAWVVAIGFALSFGASVLVTRSEPSAAFFLLHTRAWEMLGGGLVYLLAGRAALSPAIRRGLELGGLLLIVASVALFDKTTSWPGWRAMLPVAAAMMVVMANGSSVLTAAPLSQWLGNRSYSLYLWHWPVCVALFYLELSQAPLAIAFALLCTLALGHLSYVLVENRVRSVLPQGQWRAAGVLVLGVGFVAVLGVLVWKQQGIGGRFPHAVEIAAAEADNINLRKAACHPAKGASSPSCLYGVERTLILVGDSHGDAVVTAVGGGVMQWTYSGCLFLPGMKNTPAFMATVKSDYQCAAFNDWVSAQLDAAPPDIPVLIVGRYAGAALGVNEGHSDIEVPSVYFSKVHPVATPEFLEEFASKVVSNACHAAKRRTVYMMRPIPEMGVNVPKTMSRRLSFGRDGEVSISMEQYLRRNAWILAAQDKARDSCGIRILDPLPYLCHDGRCYGSKAGRALYFDDDHLSEFGNKLLAPMFEQVVKAR